MIIIFILSNVLLITASYPHTLRLVLRYYWLGIILLFGLHHSLLLNWLNL